MSLPEPNEYQMVLNLQAALLAIAVASGYYHDLSPTAVRLDANANIEELIGENQVRPFVLINVLPETRTYSPAMRVDIATPIEIHFVNEPPDPDDATRLREFFRARADIERAVTRDITRGGTAIDTKILDNSLEQVDGTSLVWTKTQLRVLSRRVYGAA
jgi:hypothetical protein